MLEREGINSLKRLIKKIVKDGVKNKADWHLWRKNENNERFMEKIFDYQRIGNMPKVNTLVSAFFHPEEPLIGLNYTPVAHNTLHYFKSGWTLPLRICRGIVFDRQAKLVAKPFLKFFNFGENDETINLPNESFDATVKHDGHLGIIFKYNSKIILTTRGSFTSPSAIIGNEMIKKFGKKWVNDYPDNLTILVEIIHSITKVILRYEQDDLILIGANNVRTLRDYDYESLLKLGRKMNLSVTTVWRGDDIDDLRQFMKDKSIANQEGFVVRFVSGPRVKFKFATYIGKMFEAKLTYSYLMKNMIKGKLDEKLNFLPAEGKIRAQEMLKEILAVKDIIDEDKKSLDRKQKEYLYLLEDEEKRSNSYKTTCRSFLLFLKSENKK